MTRVSEKKNQISNCQIVCNDVLGTQRVKNSLIQVKIILHTNPFLTSVSFNFVAHGSPPGLDDATRNHCPFNIDLSKISPLR